MDDNNNNDEYNTAIKKDVNTKDVDFKDINLENNKFSNLPKTYNFRINIPISIANYKITIIELSLSVSDVYIRLKRVRIIDNLN